MMTKNDTAALPATTVCARNAGTTLCFPTLHWFLAQPVDHPGAHARSHDVPMEDLHDAIQDADFIGAMCKYAV